MRYIMFYGMCSLFALVRLKSKEICKLRLKKDLFEIAKGMTSRYCATLWGDKLV